MESIFSHPVLTSTEAKRWETDLLADTPAEWAAMQKAGNAIALSVCEDFQEIGGLPESTHLLVLVGKGHNGGDALLAAGEILDKYPQATADVLLCFGESALRPLAQRSLETLRTTAGMRCRSVTLAQLKTDLASYDVCLDGVFGFQFRAPMDETTAEILAWVNTHPRIRLRAAVDLPSGLGETNASTVFRADFTYATGIVKSPLLLPANAAFVGRLRYLDLGFFDLERADSNAPDRVLLPSILAPLANLRSPQSDKRTFGHVGIVGGSHSYPGAVVLAVRAALRSGAGLVTAFVPERFAPEYAARYPEAMWVGCPVGAAGGLARETVRLVGERLVRANALLIGPGLGADLETLGTVQEIVRNTNIPLVLDADALRPEVIVAAMGKPFICTPHAGEFARIGGGAGLREFCEASGAVVVLKGPITQVCCSAVLQPAFADADRGLKHRATIAAIYQSLFGGPVLARGGSGDMLAGLIGGLLAQTPESPLLAACRGVVWHGLAADLLARAHGQVAVENSQLLEQLGPALLFTHARLTDGAPGVHGSERPA